MDRLKPKKIFRRAAAIGILLTAFGAQAGASIQNCSTCQLLGGRTRAMQPLTAPGAANDSLGLNVAAILNSSRGLNSPLEMPSPTLSQSKVWDGTGELPGAFQRPWELQGSGSASFDPSFKTSYWSETQGPINSPMAPWNQALPSMYGTQFYNLGMATLGLPILPVPGNV